MENFAYKINSTVCTKENDYKKSIESSILFPNQFIFLYNSYSSEIVYQKGFKEFLGGNHQLVNKASFLSLVHPDEREKIKTIFNKVYKFWLQGFSEPYEQVFSMTYRLKKDDGKYYNVYSQTMIVEKHDKGLVTISMVSDITHFNTGPNVLWSLKGEGSHHFYENNRISDEKHALTARELEIVKCLSKGMDTKEVSKALNISLYTVYTHRRNMLSRMKFENILQLVNYAMKKGLITVQ